MSPLPVADEMSAAIGIRGSARTRESTIRTGDLVVDLETRIVSVHDKPVRLTGKEYSIVELLSLRKGTTVTKEMLVGHLYGGVDEPGLKISMCLSAICAKSWRRRWAAATLLSYYNLWTLSGLWPDVCCPTTKQCNRIRMVIDSSHAQSCIVSGVNICAIVE